MNEKDIMNKSKFIAELHDIGKLVDDSLKSKYGIIGHTFIDFNFTKFGIIQPSSPSWWGQYHEKTKKKNSYDWKTEDNINNWSKDLKNYIKELFLLIIADHLASSFSRSIPRISGASLDTTKLDNNEQNNILEKLNIELDTIRGIIKLWNKNFYQKEEKDGNYWAYFKTKDDLKNLFDEIDGCKSGDDFLKKYKKNLLLTPEDKAIPRNITSLYTHIMLVGKIFRVLIKNVPKPIKNTDSSISISYNRKDVKKTIDAEGDNFICYKDKTGKLKKGEIKGEWQARFIKCNIKVPHSFVRLPDINLLKKREELINNIVVNYKDNVLFHTSDFIILFLPLNVNLDEIFKEFSEYGFYIECTETIADLGILSSILDNKTLKAREEKEQNRVKVLEKRNTKVYKKILYPEVTEEIEIEPFICEVCQQKKSKNEPWIHENIHEWICDKCWKIRQMGEPFREYTEDWKDEKVCWFKFSINQDKLEKWLISSFSDYIDCVDNEIHKIKVKDVIKEEFHTLSPQIDFNYDYKEMLKEFWEEFKNEEDMKKPIKADERNNEKDYNELGVFKYSEELTKKVINKFCELFDKYFPDCSSNDESPICLSLSISNIKYPIRDHWKYFETENNNFLNIQHHNVFKDNYTKEEIELILNKIPSSPISKSSLYDVIETFERLNSDFELTIRLKEKHKDIFELYANYNIMPKKFLNIFRLVGGDREK